MEMRIFDSGHPVQTCHQGPSDSTSAYFSDGRRIVDFVLAYEPFEHNGCENGSSEDAPVPMRINDCEDTAITGRRSLQQKMLRRRVFESNLVKMGLELEYIDGVSANTSFVLIHAPFDVLLRQKYNKFKLYN
jgi:hypothetical protein